jgi:molecular chaperone GrpE
MVLFSRDLRNPTNGSDIGAMTDPTNGQPEEPAQGTPAPLDAAPAEGTALTEPDAQAVERLEREVQEWKDRALRAAADLENFRRRAQRERDEQFVRGQSEVLLRIVEVIDDLSRVAHLDPATTAAAQLHEGMLQIERKLLKSMELAGLERLDPAGQPYDPNVAEAVTMMAADAPEQDHTVGAVFQAGYRLKGTLLRPARVAVLSWQGEAPPAAEGA